MAGKMVILSGPSGVGKDTILQAWEKLNPRIQKVVTYTTRTPRLNEQNGVDYNFVTKEEFKKLVEQGAFLEHKEVFGHEYGTPLHLIHQIINDGNVAVLKIDVQGAIEAMQLCPHAISIFILPPSQEELERRIRSRATDDEAAIEKRLSHSRWELQQSHRYQHQVVNNNVDIVVNILDSIVKNTDAAESIKHT